MDCKFSHQNSNVLRPFSFFSRCSNKYEHAGKDPGGIWGLERQFCPIYLIRVVWIVVSLHVVAAICWESCRGVPWDVRTILLDDMY